MFIEAFQAVLEKACSPRQVREIEASGSCEALWRELAGSGFLELLAPEARGGAGLGWADAFPMLSLAGHFAMPAPIAQTVVSRLFTADVRLDASALITLAFTPSESADGAFTLAHVPYGMQATHVVCEVAPGEAELLPLEGATRSPTGIHASSIAARIKWTARPRGTPLRPPRYPIALVSASLHAALLAGAMERVLEISLRYAEDRTQFGKPIGKFQAVQQQMAVMAEQVAAARMAAQLPFAHECGVGAVAVAKARCSEAAGVVAASAHAVHGAIGVTSEYDLQLFTRRLHEWRIADGAEASWHERIGRELLREDACGFAAFAQSLEIARA